MGLIDNANREAFKRLDKSNPELTGIVYAKDVLPEMDKYTIGHAGPPIKWEDMCGPLKGAVLGAIRYEGLCETDVEAGVMVESGKIKFRHNHSVDCVGPMTGMITYSMPLFEVSNLAFGNKAYCSFNEGLGKVMRFGANGPEVIKRLKWIEEELAPAFKKALDRRGPVNLKVLMTKALAMGDEMHQRNTAASSLFVREIAPALAAVTDNKESLVRIMEFITGNDQFFLNLAMAACKSAADAIKNIPYCTIVSAMSRNGTKFGVKVSGLGDAWFEADCLMPKGLYFPGFTAEDGNPDIGDSAICETYGIGGFAMGGAPAVVRFVGAQSAAEAVEFTNDMMEICEGASSQLLMPSMDFQGVPSGIDIRKVVETGLLPVINTGIAHKEAGVGQVGAGIVRAPMDCFTDALAAFAKKVLPEEEQI
ncbi:MAG: DUF1116 domain-containing protein [Clostridiales bacterium]|jgi:hypothetical protein|nr:DUF1116 domain-containing protein [Clostridiales bacterium]